MTIYFFLIHFLLLKKKFNIYDHEEKTFYL